MIHRIIVTELGSQNHIIQLDIIVTEHGIIIIITAITQTIIMPEWFIVKVIGSIYIIHTLIIADENGII